MDSLKLQKKLWYTSPYVPSQHSPGDSDTSLQTGLTQYANAHNSQPLSSLNISPYESVSLRRPRIPFTFDLNLTRDSNRTCISQVCSDLHEHSHYDKTDLDIFVYRTLSKPLPQGFLAVETATLQVHSTVYDYTLCRITSLVFLTKTYHEGKPLPIRIFVLKRNLAHVHHTGKTKPLRIGPYNT